MTTPATTTTTINKPKNLPLKPVYLPGFFKINIIKAPDLNGNTFHRPFYLEGIILAG